MPLPDRTTVLIVGAGPTGLTAALSLLHHGFHDFIIVDAASQGQNGSRSIVFHAATLEALDTIGCGDDIVSRGLKSSTFNISTRSAKLISYNFESLASHTRHPYTLVIPQNLTELTLEAKLASLGVVVHRPLRVVGLKRNSSNSQLSDVTLEDGRVIMAKYVIGADGAHSVVRAMAGIRFSDPTIVESEAGNILAHSIVADISFEATKIDDATSGMVLSRDNCLIWIPLPSSYNEYLATNGQASFSERIYRIGFGVTPKDSGIPESPSKEDLQNLIDQYGPDCLSSDPAVNPDKKPTCVKDIVWSTHFRNRAAIADTMFARLGSGEPGEGGVVLLIGDAAHIHSPVGGQGMNLGVRDAIMLGEVLTKHVRAIEAEEQSLPQADEILRAFATARHARGLEAIGLTKRFLSVVGMKYRERMAWWCPIDSQTLRVWVLWVVGRIAFARRKIAWDLSGLGRR